MFVFEVAGFVVCVWCVLRAVAPRLRFGRRPRGPVCGACGYSLDGAAELRCPECGRSVFDAGIFTPRMAVGTRRDLAAAILSTVLLAFLGASLISAVAGPWLTTTLQGSSNSELQSWKATSTSPAYSVALEREVLTFNRSIAEVRLWVIRSDQATASLVVDLARKRVRITDLAGQPFDFGSEFEQEDIQRLFDASGVPPNTPELRRQVEAIGNAVQSCLAGNDPLASLNDGGLRATNLGWHQSLTAASVVLSSTSIGIDWWLVCTWPALSAAGSALVYMLWRRTVAPRTGSSLTNSNAAALNPAALRPSPPPRP